MTEKKVKTNRQGFALLVSIITTGILLLISLGVANIALKQLVISNTYQSSQYAFYIADSGMECAMFWDLKNPNNPIVSAFATTTAGTITCNGQTVTTNSEPSLPSQIGGGGTSKPISIFSINFGSGCAIVTVDKTNATTTTINSHGYNTCSPLFPRKYERGITITY